MLSFTQFILESGDSAHEFEEVPSTYKSSKSAFYKFIHRDSPFTVQILHHDTKNIGLNFEDGSKSGGRKYAISHKHPKDAVKILSTVHHIVKHHLNKNPEVEHVHFTSDNSEPSRTKLYKKYTSNHGGENKIFSGGTEYTHSIPAANLRDK